MSILFISSVLTECLHHEVSRRRVVESTGEIGAVPDQQFLVGWNGVNGVKVDAHAILASRQILLMVRVRRIHVAHPVALLLVQAVHEVMELVLLVNLERKRMGERDSDSGTGLGTRRTRRRSYAARSNSSCKPDR